MNTPVLFLIFNRLETTRKVFKQIRQARPEKIYIASDGPRSEVQGEARKVIEVRDYVLGNVDWDCEVKTLFQDKNLGCKHAVSGSIDWFFQNEKKGIILEDDCLPSSSFFKFCGEMLSRYENDKRVWHICGNNFQDGITRGDASYYFSKYTHVWGWATWSDRWEEYDVGIKSFPKFKSRSLVEAIWTNQKIKKHWMQILTDVYENKIDTWDYQWVYTCWINNGLSIIPSTNLVENIGFGEGATHTVDLNSSLANLASCELNFPIVDEKMVVANRDADNYSSRDIIQKNIVRSIYKRISKILTRGMK